MKNSFLGVLAFLTLLFVGVGANPAQASGSLDSSFDSDGKVITVFGLRTNPPILLQYRAMERLW